MTRVVLVLGGARSGKSTVAERLAAETGDPVTYVATGAPAEPTADASWAARVDAHRARRAETWSTVELPRAAQGDATPDLAGAVGGLTGTVLVDSLGAWIARSPAFAVDAAALCRCLEGREGTTVVVSDEVGLGVVPETELGNRFRDALGELNRAVAEIADDVFLVVAGRRLRLER